MSTEHHPSTSLGADDPYALEYGETPAGAQYEHTDIDPAIGYKFALWLTVAMVLSFGIVYGAFWFFERQERAASTTAQQFPLAAPQGEAARAERPRPTPALQNQPFMDIYTLRRGEAEKLNSYGWVDKDGGVARIPIDRAMELLLQRGLPVRPEARDALNVVTQDSSSGRTVVRR
jgi:hypothetical protein